LFSVLSGRAGLLDAPFESDLIANAVDALSEKIIRHTIKIVFFIF
jgi:hypothetical protein